MHPIDDCDEDDNDINFRFNDLKVRHSCQEKFQSNPSCGKVRCTNHRRISPQRPTDHRHSALVRPRSEVRRCTRHDICWNKTQVRFNVQPDPVCRRPGGLPRSVEIADDWDSRKSIRRLYINPNPLSRKNGAKLFINPLYGLLSWHSNTWLSQQSQCHVHAYFVYLACRKQ